MSKLDRVHYLKHYLGGFAMVLNQEQTVTGELEQIDIEDKSILVKAGERSQWIDANKVTPSLKQFKNLTTEDVHCIVDHLIFDGKAISESEILDVKFEIGHVFVLLNRSRTIWITKNWSIVGMENMGTTPDNIGTIIFLLCELGYDVTGIFK